MSTEFFPLSGRAEICPSYALTFPHSASSIQKEVSSSSFLASQRLQQLRSITQEFAHPHFKAKGVEQGQTLSSLAKDRFSRWEEVMNADWILLTKRMMQVRKRFLLRAIEVEKLYQYLQTCHRKLKENFHHYYLQLKERFSQENPKV